MASMGSAPTLVGKVYTSAELKTIRIAVLTVFSGLRFGHIIRVSSGNGWDGVCCFGKASGSGAVCYDG